MQVRLMNLSFQGGLACGSFILQALLAYWSAALAIELLSDSVADNPLVIPAKSGIHTQ